MPSFANVPTRAQREREEAERRLQHDVEELERSFTDYVQQTVRARIEQSNREGIRVPCEVYAEIRLIADGWAVDLTGEREEDYAEETRDRMTTLSREAAQDVFAEFEERARSLKSGTSSRGNSGAGSNSRWALPWTWIHQWSY